jgi:D-glycero-alpha-D-manno-heptose-7-phosphate kinase
MKEALLTGRIHQIGEILDFGFRQKQKMAEGISNAFIGWAGIVSLISSPDMD